MFVEEKRPGEPVVAEPALVEPALDETGQCLWRAADYMQAHGWCQGTNEDAVTGAVCIQGAIFKTASSFMHHTAMLRVVSYLNDAVVYWNDNHCGSPQEAVTALRRAACFKPENWHAR